MNHLTKVRLIQNLNEQELRQGIKLSGSWHQKVIFLKNFKYKDSAYIYIGGLNYEMNEGDIVVVFSQ